MDTYVTLSAYSVLYTIEQIRIPSRSDYAGLTDLTSAYLDSFFVDSFANVGEVAYVSSTTENTGSEFRLGQPVRVDYNTTILFSAESTLIPSVSELDSIVEMGFTGDQAGTYLAELAGLPTSNIFSTTTEIGFTTSASSVVASGRTTTTGGGSVPLSSNAGIAAAAGAGALVLLAGGYFLFGRRREKEPDNAKEKIFDNDGQITVAGDTYAETFANDSQSGVISSRTSQWRNDPEADNVNLMKRPPSPEDSESVALNNMDRRRDDDTRSVSDDADSLLPQAHNQFEDVAL
jgi:hypothetical protein